MTTKMVRLCEKKLRRLKILCVNKDITIQSVIDRLVEGYLKKEEK